MLSNAYFLAKFHFDTAENEPAKNLQNLADFANQVRARADLVRAGAGGRRRGVVGVVGAALPPEAVLLEVRRPVPRIRYLSRGLSSQR